MSASFSLSRSVLDEALLAATLDDESCGALVVFQGRVRNHNEGRRVLRLEYEAYEALAQKEGGRILDEAMARFAIVHAGCVHRLGLLSLGDAAVWAGVSAHHRGDAFAACRYIIDEVKARVPIWKKEFYADGESGWVNCQLG